MLSDSLVVEYASWTTLAAVSIPSQKFLKVKGLVGATTQKSELAKGVYYVHFLCNTRVILSWYSGYTRMILGRVSVQWVVVEFFTLNHVSETTLLKASAYCAIWWASCLLHMVMKLSLAHRVRYVTWRISLWHNQGAGNQPSTECWKTAAHSLDETEAAMETQV